MNIERIKKKVAVIGGGNSAHALIPLLSKANYEVSLISSKPGKWKKKDKIRVSNRNW